MNMIEFTRDIYPIQERIKKITSNPFKVVMESDDLPYDDIRILDGELQKVVEVSADRYVSVMELISYSKEEMDICKDEDLKAAWEGYMENVTLEPVTLESISVAIKQYMEKKKNQGAYCV